MKPTTKQLILASIKLAERASSLAWEARLQGSATESNRLLKRSYRCTSGAIRLQRIAGLLHA